jgi:hypothetical protein
MPVVQVGIMRMAVDQPCVPVGVDMGLGRRAGGVRMPMMRVMHMNMLMLQRVVHMLMQVLLAEMQPEPDRHQQAADDEGHTDRFP